MPPISAILATAEQHLAAGRIGSAAQLVTTFIRDADPATRDALAPMLARVLGAIDPSRYDERFEADLLTCFALPADHQLLARATARLILLKHDGDLARDPTAAADDPLLAAFLTHCVNVDPAMERALIALRDRAAAPWLITRLALQAEANEYVWSSTPGTNAIAIAQAMHDRPADERGLPAPLVERLFAEPARQAALAATVPALVADEAADPDTVSHAVRDHYEANPYPRWQALPRAEPGAFIDHVRHLPGLAEFPAPNRLLVAGCGTGFEAIHLAMSAPTATVTALDLSRAALGYAATKAADAGVAIDWRCGDLLALPGAAIAADVATCTGVLHHMADPAAGLTAIVAVVRPGGLVRVAVYSRAARTVVAQAHALIAERGWQPDLAGIRALRQHVLALPDTAPLAMLRHSDDFYSASGCRDLLFHRHEKLFTLPDLEALVRGVGLTPVALDVDARAARLYAETFRAAPDRAALGRWHQLEQRHRGLFAGMYHLWCRKPE